MNPQEILSEQQRAEQLQTLASILEVQEKERNETGVILQDNVNQILVATKMILESTGNNLPEFKYITDTCIDNIQAAINENRKLANYLLTPSFNNGEFLHHLINVIESTLKPAGIKNSFNVTYFAEELLNYNQLLTIYRIVQEHCLTITKYDKVHTANIFLSISQKAFVMKFYWDGSAADNHKETEEQCFKNINTRLSIFKGTAEKVTDNKQFALTVQIPLS